MQCSSRSKFQVVLGGAMQIPGTRWSGNLTPGLISRLQCPQAVGLFMIEQIPVMALREDVCPMRDGGFCFMFSLCTLQIGDMWRCLLYFYVRLFSSVKKKLLWETIIEQTCWFPHQVFLILSPVFYTSQLIMFCPREKSFCSFLLAVWDSGLLPLRNCCAAGWWQAKAEHTLFQHVISCYQESNIIVSPTRIPI